MTFKYNKLFALLVLKNMTGKDLREITGLSGPTITKLKKGESVTTDVLARICSALECDICDIMEFVPEDKK